MVSANKVMLGRKIMVDRKSTGLAAVALIVALATITRDVRAADGGLYPTDWKGEWRHDVNRAVEVQGTFDQTKRWGPGQQAPLTQEYQRVLRDSMQDQANGGLGNYPPPRAGPAACRG